MPGPMRRPAVLFLAAATLLLAPASPVRAAARVLDLPLYDPARGQTAVPAYDARRIVLELKADGPRLLAAPGSLRGAPAETESRLYSVRPTSTGVAAIDQLDARYGVLSLEPVFRGEVQPDPASGLEDLTRFYVIELPEGADLEGALEAYAALPEVASASPSPIMPVSFMPNDPLTSLQWQLGQANDRDSDVYEAWDTFKGDTTIVVAIVDTGVLYAHEDLGGTTAPYTAGNIWTNFAELGGTPGVDDDGNGFVDDFRGWDFVASAAGAAGEDLTTPDNDPKDYVGHGTFCAGMASARTNNGVGVAGTAFKAKIMPVRAGWDNGTGGVVDLTWCAQAVNYAVAKGANVINCSWSNSSTPVLTSAVNNAIAKGVTVCVAAGNDNTQSQANNFLSTRGDCVDVAAIDANDERATFSNFGQWIDVSAAGDQVTSTYSNHYSPTYATGSGTSYASPFTAGAVALFQGYRRSQGRPLYNAARMLLRLRDTGDDIDALNPAFQGALGARLNVNRLLNDPPASWVDVLGGNLSTSPALVDLDGDGDEEVVIGATDGKLYAFTGADGDTVPGWPVALASSINSSPAIWDMDLDGHPDVLVGTNAGKLWAFHGNGTGVAGWPVQLSGAIYGGPAVGDLASPAGFESCVATETGDVYVLNAAGSVMPGWPKHVNGAIYATPALHDFDGDGLAEIVVGAYDSTLYVWHGDGTTPPGWPIKLGAEVYSSAAVGDVDHDGPADIVVGCNDSKVYGFHYDGSPLANWPVTVANSVRGSPALADLWNNDGLLEVAIASDGPTLYVIRGDGTFAPGWPQALGGPCIGGVVIGNMDTDPGLELAVGTTQKQLYVFDADGGIKLNYPRVVEGTITGTPTLGDPDKDGRAELLFGDGSRRVRAIDFGPGTYNASLMPWPTMHRDNLRRGSVSNLLVAAPAPGGSVARGLAFAASPNPSSGGAVRLKFTRDGDLAMADPDAPVGVRIVSINGTLARSLVIPGMRGSNATLVWDGNDAQGRALPAGMYFIVATWGQATAKGRIVRL